MFRTGINLFIALAAGQIGNNMIYSNYFSINRGTFKDEENFLKLWGRFNCGAILGSVNADFMAHLILSKNNPWVIFNKIRSCSMTLSEGNCHSFRICLANERYFHIKSFSGERFSAVYNYISLTGLI